MIVKKWMKLVCTMYQFFLHLNFMFSYYYSFFFSFFAFHFFYYLLVRNLKNFKCLFFFRVLVYCWLFYLQFWSIFFIFSMDLSTSFCEIFILFSWAAVKDQIIATNEASTIKCSLLSEGISGRERAKSI